MTDAAPEDRRRELDAALVREGVRDGTFHPWHVRGPVSNIGKPVQLHR